MSKTACVCSIHRTNVGLWNWTLKACVKASSKKHPRLQFQSYCNFTTLLFMLIAHRQKDIKKMILTFRGVGLWRTLQSYGLTINQEHLAANPEKMDLQLKFFPNLGSNSVLWTLVLHAFVVNPMCQPPCWGQRNTELDEPWFLARGGWQASRWDRTTHQRVKRHPLSGKCYKRGADEVF